MNNQLASVDLLTCCLRDNLTYIVALDIATHMMYMPHAVVKSVAICRSLFAYIY